MRLQKKHNYQVIKKKQTQSCYSKPTMFYMKIKIKTLSYGQNQETWILIFYVWQCFLCRLKECGWTMELAIIVVSFKLNSMDMDDENKLTLLGFHATTGNDYASSFFRRGKEKSWNVC